MKVRHPRVVVWTTLWLLAVFFAAATAGYFVWQKHRWAQTVFSETEPRHARLLGLEAARPGLDAALVNAQALRSQLVYPSTQDANQTGNAAQQRVRDILSASGLQVLSSQVLPPASGKDKVQDWDRIALSVRTEGDALALYSALAVLSGQVPVMVINELDVQVQSQLPNAAPRLSMQFSFVVLREPN
jgi:general secretion pathway protein M